MANPSFRSHTELISGGTGATIIKPAGTVDGDLVIIFIGSAISSVSSGPTGFGAAIASCTGISGYSGGGLFCYAKVASGEPASWAATLSSTFNYVIHAITIKDGATTGQPDDVDTFISTGFSSATPANITTVANDLLVAGWGCSGNETTWTKPPSMTHIDVGNNGGANACSQLVAYESVAAAGNTGTRTSTRGGFGNSGYGSIMVAVKAAPAAAPPGGNQYHYGGGGGGTPVRMVASGVAKASYGKLRGFFDNSAVGSAVAIYNGPDGSGTPFVQIAAAQPQRFTPVPANFSKGLYVVLTGDITVIVE